MKHQSTRANVESLSELRDNLSEQYRSAGEQCSSSSSSLKRRRVGLAFAAVLAIPASLAVAGEFSGERSFSWDGETLRMDGEILECPVDSSIEAEVGFDPCQIFSPAPAPLDSRESGAGSEKAGPQGGSLQQLK